MLRAGTLPIKFSVKEKHIMTVKFVVKLNFSAENISNMYSNYLISTIKKRGCTCLWLCAKIYSGSEKTKVMCSLILIDPYAMNILGTDLC